MTETAQSFIDIQYRTQSQQLSLAVDSLRETLTSPVVETDLRYAESSFPDIIVLAGKEDEQSTNGELDTDILRHGESEEFRLTQVTVDNERALGILAADETGAMYGIQEVAEQVRMGTDVGKIQGQSYSPDVPTRAIKFNLPWSPYREGPQNDIHIDTCLDIQFWKQFLDMMAQNRFNVLSLWNLHPFSYMIEPENFPEATSLSEEELQEWKQFWHSLFEMASNRGIKTYIVNWNAIVSPEFASKHEDKENYRELVDQYTQECVTQTINEYNNLTGIGVSLTNEHLSHPGVCEWFRDLDAKERQDWLDSVILKGIENADRPVKFLNRSVRTDSIDEMRRVIDSAAENPNVEDITVPTKFNWSHGHSSTKLELTHDYSDGTVDDSLWNPKPENYSLAWTVRNEDFFILRWGDHEFIRDHIETNFQSKEYVSGYIIGSEAFVPAKDISHSHHRHQTWQYIFEKQWLFYFLWGRLLYDSDLSTERITAEFERRYGPAVGEDLLAGYTNASKMPAELASLFASTWDYALYAEGFLSFQKQLGLDETESPFISINELIYHETLDPRYVSIETYVDDEGADFEDSVTPPELANRIEKRGKKVIERAEAVQETLGVKRDALECETQDLLAWGYLSLYFADKIRAGVALENFRRSGETAKQDRAISQLKEAASYWDEVISVTENHYRPHPYAGDWRADLEKTLGADFPYPDDYFEETMFSWAKFRDQVQHDIKIAANASPEDTLGEKAEYEIA